MKRRSNLPDKPDDGGTGRGQWPAAPARLAGRSVALAGVVGAGVGADAQRARRRNRWPSRHGAFRSAMTRPPYQTPSKFAKNIVRTLANPDFAAALLHRPHAPPFAEGYVSRPTGCTSPSCHAGIPDIDPAQHKLVIHGLVKQPLVFTLDALRAIRWCRASASSNAAATARRCSPTSRSRPTCRRCTAWSSCAEWTGVLLSTLLEEAGIDPKAKWIVAEGADAAASQRAACRSPRCSDDAMIALYQNGERIDARQRLSDAAVAARLRRQHEHQVPAAASSSPTSRR